MSTNYTYHVTVSTRPRPPRDPLERFWWAAEREGWAEEDIPVLLAKVQRRFAIYVVLATAGAVDLIAGEGLSCLAALPLTVAAGAKAAEAARQHRMLVEQRSIGWGAFVWNATADTVSDLRGYPWYLHWRSFCGVIYLARQWPRRGWCWLRGGIPPAPPGTLRITHENRTADELSNMLKGGRYDV